MFRELRDQTHSVIKVHFSRIEKREDSEKQMQQLIIMKEELKRDQDRLDKLLNQLRKMASTLGSDDRTKKLEAIYLYMESQLSQFREQRQIYLEDFKTLKDELVKKTLIPEDQVRLVDSLKNQVSEQEKQISLMRI